jgi:hypothetical protein
MYWGQTVYPKMPEKWHESGIYAETKCLEIFGLLPILSSMEISV